MGHCVRIYEARVRSGKSFIYSVRGPERATLALRTIGPVHPWFSDPRISWVHPFPALSQLKGLRNAPVSAATAAAVEAWLADRETQLFVKSVTALFNNESNAEALILPWHDLALVRRLVRHLYRFGRGGSVKVGQVSALASEWAAPIDRLIRVARILQEVVVFARVRRRVLHDLMPDDYRKRGGGLWAKVVQETIVDTLGPVPPYDIVDVDAEHLHRVTVAVARLGRKMMGRNR